MATTGARPKQSTSTSPAVPASAAQARPPRPEKPLSASGPENAAKPVGYGLPCANCRLYYPADLDTCPTCNHRDRVSPVVPKLAPQRTEALPNPVPDSAAVEQQREEFLRQFKSQTLDAPGEAVVANGSLCSLMEHHEGGESSAEICKECYQHLRERIDICEAALHMDQKEAAQIIYDAVWADPSDPNKTYENAAAALLAELRKRSGVGTPRSPFQPLPD